MGSNAKKDTPFVRADFLRLAEEQYGDRPEYLWRTSPHNAVLRHPENRKWYAVLMQVSREKLGLAGAGPVDIVDLKCDPALAGSLRLAPGILPGYHMHKGNWITLVLDGSVEEETVRFLLDRSHSLTAQGAGTKPPAGGRTWLIPANPKYYDVEAAFAAQDTIRWKQSSRVAVGDTIYLYVAAPVSAILYQCKAVEVDIPFRRTRGPVKLERVMEIQRLHQFRPDQLTLDILRSHGVYAVRGPRSVPEPLLEEIHFLLRQAGKEVP